MRSLAKQESGFALVVTLSLMVLLAILCVGMLSLASVEMRTSGASKHDAIARQNALLALQLAIGELQEHLGPDKRTSANAELLADGSPNPHWVGAWNTEGGFRSWLVSGNENTPLQTDPATDASAPPFSPYNALTSSLPTDPGVVLVGEHTAGADTANHVAVPKVLLKEPGDAHPTGRYAWWVGDEGQKANMAAEVQKLPENNMADRLEFLASSPNRGFPTLGGEWKSWLPDGSDAVLAGTGGKFPTRRQIPLANSELVDDEKERFHDFTVSSAGVMSDSKYGGLKKDLSIAFEIPEQSFRNSEFTRVLTEGEPPAEGAPNTHNAYATSHSGRMAPGPMDGRPTKTAVNYRDYAAWPPGYFFRGPTFDHLRDHYQLYRRISNPFSANASIKAQTLLPNATVTKGSNIRGRGPFGDYARYPEAKYFNAGGDYEVTDTYGSTPRIRPMATELLPELVRYTYTLAIQSFPDPVYPGHYQLRLIMTPFMILHNPYNVELNSNALWYRIQRSELQARFEYTGLDPVSNTTKTHHTDNIWMDWLVEEAYGNVTAIESAEGAYDAMDFFASDDGKPSGTITMKPGEFKIFTSRGSAPTEGKDIFAPKKNRSIFLQTKLDDLFSTGVSVTVRRRSGWHTGHHFTIPAGVKFKTTVSVSVPGQGNGAGWPTLAWSANEYHTILSKVVSPGVTEPVPTGESQKWDQIRMLSCFQDRWWTGPLASTFTTQLAPEDIQASPAGPRRYIGRIDKYQKPLFDGTSRDNNISLTTHNPRGMVQTMSMSGAQGPASVRGPVTWTGSATALDPATSSSPGFDNRFWGTSTSLTDGGQSTLMLYDIPRAPILSLASLQHANVSRQGVSSAYAIGNSYASPYVPSNSVWWRSSKVPPQNTSTQENFWIFDNSYLFNESLFDSYYFSGVNPGSSSSGWNNALSAPSVSLGGGDPTSISPLQKSIDDWRKSTGALLNPRMSFVNPTWVSPDQAAKDLDLSTAYSNPQTKLSTTEDLRPHNSIAAYTLNQGAFNINSISVEAWRVLLAGLRGSPVPHFSSSSSLSSSADVAETPYPGSSMPGSGSATGSDSDLWNGFRSLDDSEITVLAEEIVAEIKIRARQRASGTQPRPITTFAEFINRRLGVASDPFSKSGILQAALDRTANSNTNSLSDQPVRPADKNFKSTRLGQPETNTVPYANPEALATQTIAGTPQWLTQADLLERIGSQLSARSDTFTVRAYGESVNPDNGQVLSRAWLEATVQRTPCFVNPNDHPALPVASTSLSNESKTYGRRFTVISLRWLRPEEI